MSDSEGREPLWVSGGTLDITPEGPARLAGFAGAPRVSSGVHSRLELNAVLLERASGRILFLSGDLLYGGPLRDFLESEFAAELQPEEIFFVASHTHFAPGMDESLGALGSVDSEQVERVLAGAARLVRRVLAQERVPAFATFVSVAVPGAVQRRRPGLRIRLRPRPSFDRGVYRRSNPQGSSDPCARVLGLWGEDGDLVALLWGWSCHPSAFPEKSLISAEYPGVVRSGLRREHRSDLPVVFLQGFAGDQRADFVEVARGLKRRFSALLEGEAFRAPSLPEWEEWSARIAFAVGRAARDKGECLVSRIRARRITSERPVFSFEGSAPESLVAHEVSLSRELSVVGLSAEPMCEHGGWLREAAGHRQVIPVGYLDRTRLYLPTEKMIAEGGYEGGGFLERFGLRGRYSEGLDREVRALFRRAVGEPR